VSRKIELGKPEEHSKQLLAPNCENEKASKPKMSKKLVLLCEKAFVVEMFFKDIKIMDRNMVDYSNRP
jgi:hypothetical protein